MGAVARAIRSRGIATGVLEGSSGELGATSAGDADAGSTSTSGVASTQTSFIGSIAFALDPGAVARLAMAKSPK
jgi:hypothetical protein